MIESNKELGQHFMVDKPLLRRIIDQANITSLDSVLEIGPGPGALTSLLKEKTNRLITVDIDERFEATIHGNILELIETISFDTLVSNLPYHISEPLFIKLTFFKPKKIIVVVGEQFAKHLQEESILGCVFRDIYSVKTIEVISPESFNPPPNVSSALVECTLKETSGLLEDFYSYPKSKVKNYLKTKTSKRGAQEFINKLPALIQEKRLYELNKNEFLELRKIIQTM